MTPIRGAHSNLVTLPSRDPLGVTPRKHLEIYLYRNGDDEVKYSYVQVVMCSLNFCLVCLTNYNCHLKI
jgi:hypothetical protein